MTSLIFLVRRSLFADVEKIKYRPSHYSLRLVRVDLPSGEREILVSSLTDLEAYPTSLFADLYFQRWGVEEDYKVLKSPA